jgi:hypothetical protein
MAFSATGVARSQGRKAPWGHATPENLCSLDVIRPPAPIRGNCSRLPYRSNKAHAITASDKFIDVVPKLIQAGELPPDTPPDFGAVVGQLPSALASSRRNASRALPSSGRAAFTATA